jgi:superfamily II DNA/RNA helicase
LRRLAAVRTIKAEALIEDAELTELRPDWARLLLGASVLATSDQYEHLEIALMVAQAALLFGPAGVVKDAGAVVLSQLANQRALSLALARGVLPAGLDERLGISEQLNQARRELEQTIFLRDGKRSGEVEEGQSLSGNVFQLRLWDILRKADWVSATAPTAAGKTYLVLRWLLDQILAGAAQLAIFIVPTRALVAEIERSLLDLAADLGIPGIRVGSLPLAALGDRARPTVLVFTQERLHVFLNSVGTEVKIDVAVVDEAHKLGDGIRGVILQDAIERLVRSSPATRVIFLSPLTENPEAFVEDAPPGSVTEVIQRETPTVTQNLILATQMPKDAQKWRLLLRQDGDVGSLGRLDLHASPDGVRKRLSYVALALGREHTGTLIYANDANEAEQVASQIFDGLTEAYAEDTSVAPELIELSEFARDTIHPDYALVDYVKRGVAFHYGNMPSLLRYEIERLFKDGVIRFLVCTSTLVEGVNLACQTIVVRGPRKGKKDKMTPHDFWNLAGRAGRWGQDFSGNIVCVDSDNMTAWPNGVPRRSRYAIKRKTEAVVEMRDELLAFIRARPEAAGELNLELEQVTAYLMSWRIRQGTIVGSTAVLKFDPAYIAELDVALAEGQAKIDFPAGLVLRHPGVSAFALQSLLNYFRQRKGDVADLLPATPDSSDARDQLIAVFTRIHNHMFPAFVPLGRVAVFALTTVNWMRGYPLVRIIRERISWLEARGAGIPTARAIRDTMKDVEEIARFKAPKYLSAYMDVLRLHLSEIGREELLTDRLNFELYLEFGVGTKTLISMIGLGLSRTSAVEINDWLGNDDLDEVAVLARLRTRRWQSLPIPKVVKRELTEVLARLNALVA